MDWRSAMSRYFGVSIGLHFVWEILQLPLYTIWQTGSFRQQAFAVLHCTIGDAMIAALALLLAVMLFGHATWPGTRAVQVYSACLALGVGYTIYSEWVNVSVRGSWAYSDLMPTLPIIGTGLAPLLQWLVVPTIAQMAAIGRIAQFPNSASSSNTRSH